VNEWGDPCWIQRGSSSRIEIDGGQLRTECCNGSKDFEETSKAQSMSCQSAVKLSRRILMCEAIIVQALAVPEDYLTIVGISPLSIVYLTSLKLY